jgi:hypothetical protein
MQLTYLYTVIPSILWGIVLTGLAIRSGKIGADGGLSLQRPLILLRLIFCGRFFYSGNQP